MTIYATLKTTYIREGEEPTYDYTIVKIEWCVDDKVKLITKCRNELLKDQRNLHRTVIKNGIRTTMIAKFSQLEIISTQIINP